MKVKIFEGMNHLDRYDKQRGIKYLEEQVQDWLRENDRITVRHIKQSSFADGESGGWSRTVISIWYDY